MSAAALAWLPRGFSPQLLVFCLLALQYSPADSESGVKVTQQPPFRAQPKGQTLELECSVNQDNYYFYWYHQLPGQTELQPLGHFTTFENDLKEPSQKLKARLNGERDGKISYLKLTDLQADDGGLYFCSAKDTVLLTGKDAAPASSSGGQFGKGRGGSPSGGRAAAGKILQRSLVRLQRCDEQAYFAERGTQVFLTDPDCENGRPPPNAFLLGPTCHKKSTTLVCLAQGFFYEWPLDVIWKRDGQEVPRLAVATEKPKAQGKCRFDIASRLRVSAEEWREGHTYSCHVSQGNATAEAKYTHQWRQQQYFGLSDTGQSLRIGQLVFLLLAVKSFAYGTVLGIYTVYRKKNL